MKDNKKDSEYFDIVVVGGGASGMMAAGCLHEKYPNLTILILEKEKHLGKKLGVTGGGRCNITNAEFETRKFLANYGEGEQFLYSAFSQFNVKDSFSFFEAHGLPLIEQEGQRVFPITEKALDVVAVMEKYVRQPNITIRLNEKVKQLIKTDNQITGIISDQQKYRAKNIILSTGSLAHPKTGSSGESLKWLAEIGHTVMNPAPTLVPLAVKDSWVKALSGISLKLAKITFLADDIKKFSAKGKILFTHFGLSGPLILNNAVKVSDILHGNKVTAQIDMFPDKEISLLKKDILNIFEKNKNKLLKNVLSEIVPAGCANAIFSILKDFNPETRINNLKKEQRESLVKLLKAMPLTITGLMGYDKAIVADGGIPLSEINTKTMQSNLYKNLFITGDLLHIRRPSGGYSLQLCWTTGFVAGTHAGKNF